MYVSEMNRFGLSSVLTIFYQLQFNLALFSQIGLSMNFPFDL
jgi:hypothetical protein